VSSILKKKLNDIRSSSNLLPLKKEKNDLKGTPKKSIPTELSEGQTLCGNLDIRIDSEGVWSYHGSPIGRMELVKLFSSVLSMDENARYWLTTPSEKGEIFVEDVPFQAVEMNVNHQNEIQVLSFRTNIDEVVIADADHPIRIEINPTTRQPSPYIMVRDRLEARLTRSVFYQMVDLGIEMTIESKKGAHITNEQVFGVWSSEQFFQIGKLT
jgi:hypothetical protein